MTFKPLGSVATLAMGQSPRGADCNKAGEGVPLLNGPTEFGQWHPLPAQWTTDPKRFAEPSDVLFCVRGSTTGRMNRADRRYSVGRGVAAIRGSSPADTDFIYYSLQARLDDLLSLTAGSVFPNLSKGDIAGLELWWPDAARRQELAGQLRLLDDRRVANTTTASRAEAVLDALAEVNGTDLPRVALRELADSSRQSIHPQSLGGEIVDHLSIPAFDETRRPDEVSALTIRSNKYAVSRESVLVSRLNPRVPRTWYVRPIDGRISMCSTEFLVLTPQAGSSIESIWLAVRSQGFLRAMKRRVTGTSGSHQRVKPDDAIDIPVPDFRRVPDEIFHETHLLLGLSNRLRKETQSLERMRSHLVVHTIAGALLEASA